MHYRQKIKSNFCCFKEFFIDKICDVVKLNILCFVFRWYGKMELFVIQLSTRCNSLFACAFHLGHRALHYIADKFVPTRERVVTLIVVHSVYGLLSKINMI